MTRGFPRPLAITGFLHLALLAILLALAPFETRQVMGINLWIKPIKFASSIAIYCFTLGWYLRYLAGTPRTIRAISWGVSIAMVTEMIAIAGQAARGTTSHFNVHTAFDGAVFSVMGAMITLNTLLALLTLILFARPQADINSVYLAGIRVGLFVFVMASLEGFVMVARLAHTVGAPDGGPGLPFVNWSTKAGDLRAAHFLGLHALQALPFAGYLISRTKLNARWQLATMGSVAIVYLSVAVRLFTRAIEGLPL